MLQGHSPAMMPSPARLGLSNTVGSPSLTPNPNPNPNPKPLPPSSHPHYPTATTTTTTTSAALLSLLPPLPRAQSLLLHMSSLATKLFEASPHRPNWLSAFRGSLPSFLPSSSTTTTTTPSTTKEILSLFTSLQTQLFEAVSELQEILDLQDARKRLSRDLQSKDAALLAFARKLKDTEQVLDRLVDDYSDYRPHPKRPKTESQDPDSLDLQEILSFAHRISYTTFAPPEHGAGLAPLRGALPPAPQDNEMRASQLYHFADLDVGVPKARPDAKEGAAADAAAEALMEPAPAAPVFQLPITVPPGWRKGMPVELPMELPPVPPGWKPGDPIPLPPLEGVSVGGKGEEPRVGGIPVIAGAPVPKAPEAIQVKYVQLDINPDQDDYSSDYSSEVGSSDEDDED